VVGNRFVYLCRQNDFRLTSVALQKFIYFAHGWHMGFHGFESRLLDEPFEAWQLGPVAPQGYFTYVGLGHLKRRYAEIPDEVKTELNDEECQTCDFVMHRYFHLDPMDMVLLTKEEGSPWHKYRHDRYTVIPHEDIAEFYSGLVVELELTPNSYDDYGTR
jgi:uncharacterized phage-associated protein